MNYPDNLIFKKSNVEFHDNKKAFKLVYPGTLSIHQGIETAIKAISIVRKDIPDIQFIIYGKGTDETYFKKLTYELNLTSIVLFKDIVPLQDLPQIIQNADIGIEPKSKAYFSNEAFSTKILEFMIMGTPVIVSDTLVHRYYFNDEQVMFFESDNPVDCARCIKILKENRSMRSKLIANANIYMKTNNWNMQKHRYMSIVNNLNVRKGSEK
jgi:glycosyltransferase involved in cell wall biosynthesis